MARKRMIAQAIWDDPDFSSLDIPEQLLFIGMITFADDYGHLPARAPTLRKWIFGYRNDVTNEMVQGWLDNIIRACRNVKLYTVDGQDYLEFAKWQQHQELKYIAKPLYPKPGSAQDEIPQEPEQPSPSLPATGTILGNPGKSCGNCAPDQATSMSMSMSTSTSMSSQHQGASAAPPAAAAADEPPTRYQQIAREYELLVGNLAGGHVLDELRELADSATPIDWVIEACKMTQERRKGQRISQPWRYMLAILDGYKRAPPGNGNGERVSSREQAVASFLAEHQEDVV